MDMSQLVIQLLEARFNFKHNTLFIYWETPSTLFWIHETALVDLCSFWKIDIGRPKKFFQWVVAGSRRISSVI